jgi:hypothetical protein
MRNDSKPAVLSAAKLIAVGTIDDGRTVVVRLETPEEDGVALVLPRAVAAAMAARLAQTLEAPQPPRLPE